MFQGVRVAVPEDEDAVLSLFLMAHSENGQFPVNEDKVRMFIRHATERKGGIIGVIQGKEYLEAVIGMTLEPWWYTDEWCLDERINFVHPDHRKSGHARRLIEFAKWCSNEMGIPLAMGVLSNKRTEAKVKLYKRQLPCVGAVFMYRG